MKTVNLYKALCNNKHCYGFIWRFSNGKFGYQNDNDLGLDHDGIDMRLRYVKKVKLRPFGREYVYQMVCGAEDDGTGAPLKTVKALLLQCHCKELTPQEESLCNRYWNRF